MTLHRPGGGITRARTTSSGPDAPADPVVVELIVGSDWPPIQALLSSGSRGDAGQVINEHVHVVAMLLTVRRPQSRKLPAADDQDAPLRPQYREVQTMFGCRGGRLSIRL
jgi:hypothetical protein